MSDDEDPADFYSLKLAANFGRKTSAKNLPKVPLNDSFLKVPSSFEEVEPFIQRIYFTGVCPWEDTSAPHLFFTIPFDQTLFDPVSSFCFPHGAKTDKILFKSASNFISEALTEPTDEHLEFFTLYFPTIESGPYFYCCRFMGTPFSMPTISHELSLDDVFSLVNKESIPSSQMCICVQSTYPDSSLYYQFIKWLLQCEKVGKFSVTQAIDLFVQKGTYNHSEIVDSFGEEFEKLWPDQHRDSLSELAARVIFQPIPAQGSSLLVDTAPFPKFEWNRPTGNRKELSFAVACMKTLLTCAPLNVYMQLLSALVLEKTIIVHSKRPNVLTEVILAFHFLLYPLKWVAPSISILPDSALDILDSPSPTLLGLDNIPKNMQEHFVYFDCDTKQLSHQRTLLTFPHQKSLMERFTPLFATHGKENEILSLTNMAVKDLLSPVRASIITDFSDPKNAGSRFLPELFLKNFPQDIRLFINNLMKTQMFQFHVELECRKCSAVFDEQMQNSK